MNRSPAYRVGMFFLVALNVQAADAFPHWKPTPLTPSGAWDRAQDVLVGDIGHPRAIGSQRFEHLPVPQDLHVVYWCAAKFFTQAVIKGTAPARGKDLVWGSVQPGCTINYGAPKLAQARTKIWFIQEEGDYLRPPSDGSPDLFYGLRIRWVPDPGADPQLQFGHLLLSAELNPRWTAEFKYDLFDRLSFAFAVLGENEACIRDLREMAAHESPAVRRDVCNLLRSQFQVGC